MIGEQKSFELKRKAFSKQTPSFRSKLGSEKWYLIILKFKKEFHCHRPQHDE